MIEEKIESGNFDWDASFEDVHMNIEAAPRERNFTPCAAGTIRLRSIFDFMLKQKLLRYPLAFSLQTALLDFAQQHVDVVMPGYTHLQRAQPIFLAHYLLAQIEAFARDAERFRDCNARTDVLPLGSGAVAGSTIVLDRQLMARQLGFSRVSQNSLDAVGDRDFVCELLFCLAMIGMHLSRLSEDLIAWSTSEFGFVEFSDAFSTGSSLMPQKKNPDMAELTWGKSGPAHWKPGEPAHNVERFAQFLQSWLAGRQRTIVRLGRYRERCSESICGDVARISCPSRAHGISRA